MKPVIFLLLFLGATTAPHRRLTAPAPLSMDPGGAQTYFWPSAHQGAVYQYYLEATGGTPPYVYTLNNAISGLAMIPTQSPDGHATMKLFGKVTAVPGKHNISVTVTDSTGATSTRSKPIRVCAPYTDNMYDSSQPCLN